MGNPHFSVIAPVERETPVVVEIPHAGLQLEPLALAPLIAPASALGRDADLYVDDLYADAPAAGATVLVAHTSRYVCDLNRGESDVDARAAEGASARSAPHGLIWRSTTHDEPALAEPLPRGELERRIREIYRPYHARLAELLQRKRERFGFAVLLCGHSMPSRGRNTGQRPRGAVARADVVPGSRGRSTATSAVIDLPEELARRRSWTVAHDDPYRGGFSTAYYGRPATGIHAVQVELSRRLYMDEDTLEKRAGAFEQVRDYCRELVTDLGGLDLGS